MAIKLNKVMDKGQYLDKRQWIKKYPNAVGFIVFGVGGVGKTTTQKKYILNRVLNEIKTIYSKDWTIDDIKQRKITINTKFLWLNRLDTEVEDKKKTLFKEEAFIVSGKEIFFPLVIDVKGKEYDYPLHIGTFEAINNSSKVRGGNSFEGYTEIIWDEFMDEHGKYLPNEMSKLKSILATAARTRNMKFFFLSNAVNPDCPLFKMFDFNPFDIQQGEQMYYPERKTVIYMPKMSDKLNQKYAESDLVAFLGKDDEYLKYRIGGDFKEDNEAFIIRDITNKGALKPWLNFLYLKQNLGAYKIGNKIYISEDTHSGKTWPLTKPDALSLGLSFTDADWASIYLYAMLKKGKLYFSDTMVKEIVLQFISRGR